MKLLGNYPSQLTAYHIAELKKLVDQSRISGEYEAGKLANAKLLEDIRQQGQDFSNLPLASAGSRALADSVNYPLHLLSARYAAITSEQADFLDRMTNYLEVIDKDSQLIGSLLALADQQYWIERQPKLSSARRFHWHFSAGQGLVETKKAYTDPTNPGIQYPESVSAVETVSLQRLTAASAVSLTGLGAPTERRSFTPTSLSWTYSSPGTAEDLSGLDWAKLSLLEPSPLVHHAAPVIRQLLPADGGPDSAWSNYFSISGVPKISNLPVYVKIVFLSRRQSKTKAAAETTTFLSRKLITDDLIIHNGTKVFVEGTDYTRNEAIIEWLPPAAGLEATILFTEQYPAYQCSIDERHWSPALFLDPDNPYPSESTNAVPVDIDGGRFPVTDEMVNHMGFWLEMKTVPPHEYTLVIEGSRPPLADLETTSGAIATLEIEFDKPSYMNALSLAPFTNFPTSLLSIRVEGLTLNSGQQIFSGETRIDQPCTLRFERQLVRKLYLRFRQANYTIKEHLVDPDTKDKIDAYHTLQTALPAQIRRTFTYRQELRSGYQYEFGVKEISGEDWTTKVATNLPGIFITGPFRVTNTPEIIRLDAVYSGQVDFYLLWDEMGTDGVLNTGNEQVLTPNAAIAYQSARAGSIARTDFYLKAVLREEFSVLERFLLQVTNVFTSV